LHNGKSILKRCPIFNEQEFLKEKVILLFCLIFAGKKSKMPDFRLRRFPRFKKNLH